MGIKKYLPIIIIVFLGFFLRFYNYGDFPVFGESQDELAWTWMGTSILQGKHPTSWSGTAIDGYWNEENISLGESEYRVVTPYLDNPHLFSIIPGIFALFRGFKSIELVPITIIRFPMVVIGTINIYLLFVALKKWINYKTALVSSLLFATIPTIVFSSRGVFAENLLVTWMLLSWILIYQISRKKQKKYLILLGVIGGLAGLTKIAGLVILFSNSYILLKHNKNSGIKTLIVGLIVFSLYPLYGLLASKQLFLDVILRQSKFDIGFSTILNMFIYPKLVAKTLIDGWIYFGLFSLITLLTIGSKKIPSIFYIYSLAWLGFLLIATPHTQGNGWYRYPIFPILSIAAGQIILSSKKYYFSITTLYITVFLPTLRLILLSVEKNINTRLLIIIGFTPLLLSFFKINKKYQKTIFYIFVGILIITSSIVPLVYTKESYWADSLKFYPVRIGD